MSETPSASSPRELPPRAPDYPLVGVLPRLVRNPDSFLRETQRTCGDIFSMSLGFTDTIAVAHPRHAQHILVDKAKNYTKTGPMWDSMRTFMGNALPISEGAYWKRQRKLVQPAFHHQRVSLMADNLVTIIDEHLGEWEAAARSGSPLETSSAVLRMAMGVMVRSLFGSTLPKDDARRINEAVTYIMDYFTLGMATNTAPTWVPVPGRARYFREIKLIDEIIGHFIEQARAGKADDGTALSMMLQAVDLESGEGMTNEELRNEALGFFVAGYDTTATSVIWLLHLLTQNPGAFEKVRAEQEAVLGERRPGFADLMRMPYLRNSLHESMRIHSPSIWLSRMAEEDDEIDGYHIPAGKVIVIFVHLIHHHAGVWGDPERFDPDRWLPERAEGRHKLAWLPFGAGKHQCLAKDFSMMESMLMVSRVLSRFTLSSVPGRIAQPKLGTSLRPKDGVWLNVHPRVPSIRTPGEAMPPPAETSGAQPRVASDKA